MGRFFDEQTDDDDGRTDGGPTKSTHALGARKGARREDDEVEWRRSNQKWKRNEWRTGGRGGPRPDGRAAAFNFSGQCVETRE